MNPPPTKQIVTSKNDSIIFGYRIVVINIVLINIYYSLHRRLSPLSVSGPPARADLRAVYTQIRAVTWSQPSNIGRERTARRRSSAGIYRYINYYYYYYKYDNIISVSTRDRKTEPRRRRRACACAPHITAAVQRTYT